MFPLASQLESFPCVVVSYQPFPKPETAYAKGRAIGEDGVAYIIKANSGGVPICANEWISTGLAESLHLPVAPCKVLKMPDGELVFGSAELTNRLPDHELAALLVGGVKPNGLIVHDLTSILSRLHAFDLFVGNYDRHLSNYLMSLEWSDDRTTRIGNLRAIDFDAADIVTRGNIILPMHGRTNTMVASKLIRETHPFANQPVTQMLTQLRKGREVMFEQAMYGLPSEWLSDTDRSALLKKVASESFASEIHQLEQGLSNGSYL